MRQGTGQGDDPRPGASPGQGAAAGSGWPGSGWHGARRELGVAAALVLSLAAAAWVIDGSAAASVVLLVSVAVSLIVLHALIAPPGLDREETGPADLDYDRFFSHSFTGFWRTPGDLRAATKSLAAWDQATRPRLANLLAARLAERHGVSLANEPDAARRLLLGDRSRHDLWYWIDPQRPSPPDARARPGIPLNVLAALIDRLEQL